MLVLQPVSGSALQARYNGPYVVQEKASDQDSTVASAHRKHSSRVGRGSAYLTPDSDTRATVLVLSSVEIADEPQGAEELSGVSVPEVLPVAIAVDRDTGPSCAVVQG